MGIQDMSLTEVLTNQQVKDLSAFIGQLHTDGVRPLSADYTKRLTLHCQQYKDQLAMKGRTPDWLCFFLLYKMYTEKEKES